MAINPRTMIQSKASESKKDNWDKILLGLKIAQTFGATVKSGVDIYQTGQRIKADKELLPLQKQLIEAQTGVQEGREFQAYESGYLSQAQAARTEHKTFEEKSTFKTRKEILEFERQYKEHAAMKAEVDKEHAYLKYLEATPGNKVLDKSQIDILSDGATAPGLLTELKKMIEDNKDQFGVVKGRWGKINLYNKKTQALLGKLAVVRQLVGTFLEKGKLVGADEQKYINMLPSLSDNYGVALKKLQYVMDAVNAKQMNFLASYYKTGYDISAFVNEDMKERLNNNFNGMGDLVPKPMVTYAPSSRYRAYIQGADEYMRKNIDDRGIGSGGQPGSQPTGQPSRSIAGGTTPPSSDGITPPSNDGLTKPPMSFKDAKARLKAKQQQNKQGE